MLCCMAIATLTWIWHGDMWQILFDTFQIRHDFMIEVFVLHMLDVLIMEPRQPQRWPPYILLVLSLPFAIYQFVMFEKNGYLRCRKHTNSQRKKKEDKEGRRRRTTLCSAIVRLVDHVLHWPCCLWELHWPCFTALKMEREKMKRETGLGIYVITHVIY